MKIEWQDPPPDGRTRTGADSRRAFMAEIRKSPGRWAHYPHRPKNPAIGTAFKRDFGRGNVETATRRAADGLYDLWVRWIGPTEDAA